MQDINVRGRIEAAEKLLREETTSVEKFQSIRTLLVGINPVLDKKLAEVHKHIRFYQNLHSGDLIQLSAENLPAKTERDKKKKKALLMLIRLQKNLKSEVQRVRTEFDDSYKGQLKTGAEQMESIARIIRFAKGPMGIVTLFAIVLFAASMMMSAKQKEKFGIETTSISTVKTQAIVFNNKKILLSELRIGKGEECLTGQGQAGHYHAKNSVSAQSVEGDMILDPGGCGFGKVDDTPIIETD